MKPENGMECDHFCVRHDCLTLCIYLFNISALPFYVYSWRLCSSKRNKQPKVTQTTAITTPSSFQSYLERKRYILTQTPLPSTVVNFWRAVLEFNVKVVVSLDRAEPDAKVRPTHPWMPLSLHCCFSEHGTGWLKERRLKGFLLLRPIWCYF